MDNNTKKVKVPKPIAPVCPQVGTTSASEPMAGTSGTSGAQQIKKQSRYQDLIKYKEEKAKKKVERKLMPFRVGKYLYLPPVPPLPPRPKIISTKKKNFNKRRSATPAPQKALPGRKKESVQEEKKKNEEKKQEVEAGPAQEKKEECCALCKKNEYQMASMADIFLKQISDLEGKLQNLAVKVKGGADGPGPSKTCGCAARTRNQPK